MRYSVLVTVFDNQENKELAQAEKLETDDLDDAAAEFEDLSEEDFDASQVDETDDDEPDGGDDDPEAEADTGAGR